MEEEWLLWASAAIGIALSLKQLWASYHIGTGIRNLWRFFNAISRIGELESWVETSEAWNIAHDKRVAGAKTAKGYHVPRNWKEIVNVIVKTAIREHELAKHGG